MTLKTLEKSLELLELFTKERTSWGVRELAKELGINHTTVYRILATFEQKGYLIQDHETKKYELGMKLWEFGQLVEDKMGISEYIYPIMRNVSEQTGETIFLTWLDQLECVHVEMAESSQSIKFSVSVGSRTPLHAGASNTVIMAYLPRDVQEQVIARGLTALTAHTVVEKESLYKKLDEIKKRGWCFSAGEFADEVFGLSVPLFNKRREIVGSMTIAGPVSRTPEGERLLTMLSALQEGQREVQHYLDKYNLSYV
ncbi:IclR family transcriptional regulator [Brevibacillus agri]|uniref:IclR family transcriptional regulator n=1 Tax=Brevibacillus agri TaxID=51101 RepID=UPI001C8DC4ED|nr:IclR family transcriptional regulator [Brevibacillus agri]MBY0054361.1 IclR family transcriptional regulator [Brevibacillus agri]